MDGLMPRSTGMCESGLGRGARKPGSLCQGQVTPLCQPGTFRAGYLTDPGYRLLANYVIVLI